MALAHSRPGRVESISEHSDGKHADIRVVHGKKKKDPHGDGMVGYHRASSSITVPKAHASQYRVGQRVNVGIEPGADSPTPPAPGGAPMAKGAPPKKKGKVAAKKKSAPQPSPIQAAMAPSAPGC